MNESPFKLFEPYSAKDKNTFFGREEEIFALYNLLQQTRLLLIYGASGTGKTSLIQAGLPKVFKLTDWFRVSVRRKDDINTSLQQELARQLEKNEVSDIVAAITALHENIWMPIYLVFDQFEELFTLGGPEEREQFFEMLQKLLQKPLPCKIILSMREEYIGHLYEYEPLLPTLFEKRFRVEPMKDETVRVVIEQMCETNNVRLTEGRVTANEILQNVKGENAKQAVHLPYLQVYLHYLYLKANVVNGFAQFTAPIVKEVGALGDVLKLFIETQLENARLAFVKIGLPDDFAARLLDEFATDEGTKQSRRATELAQTFNADTTKVEYALDHFSNAKLLRADENDVERYEPVHDVVAKQIYVLRSTEDKEYKTFARQLELANEAWLRDDKPKQRLLNNLDLSKVTIYEDRLKIQPNYKLQLVELINSSRAYNLEIQKQKRRERNILIGITFSAVLGLFVAIWFYKDAKNAKQKANEQLVIVSKEQIERHKLEIASSERKMEIYKKASDAFLIKNEKNTLDSLTNTLKINEENLNNLLIQQ